jgi:hypothetical protein
LSSKVSATFHFYFFRAAAALRRGTFLERRQQRGVWLGILATSA